MIFFNSLLSILYSQDDFTLFYSGITKSSVLGEQNTYVIMIRKSPMSFCPDWYHWVSFLFGWNNYSSFYNLFAILVLLSYYQRVHHSNHNHISLKNVCVFMCVCVCVCVWMESGLTTCVQPDAADAHVDHGGGVRPPWGGAWAPRTPRHLWGARLLLHHTSTQQMCLQDEGLGADRVCMV